MLFKKKPIVKEIKLIKDYKFMYDAFLLTTPNILYLFLEENNGVIDTVRFNFLIYKFGYPNDEVLSAHPMQKYGLGFYGIYEVYNSPWIEEISKTNKIHPRNTDNMYKDFKHFIITYKDNTLDIISKQFIETTLRKEDIDILISEEINSVKKY